MAHTISLELQANPLLTKLARWVLNLVLVILSFVLAALVAFVPLTALPGDLQTGFVNAGWIKFIWLGALVGVMTLRVTPWTPKPEEAWWPATLRGLWAFVSTFVGFFWLTGGLVWINAYGVQDSRTHDMVVAGYERMATSAGGSAIEHYKLSEIGTSWTADLEPTDERDSFASKGACVRIVVREGRLGLDWIDDALPINCPTAATPETHKTSH